MTTIQNPIDQFTADASLAHQIVHGDQNTTVATDGGPVRSLAKLVADNQEAINTQVQVTIADFPTLRAYTGTRTYAVISAPWVGGEFVSLGTGTGLFDNGGTIIVDAAGRAWQRIFAGPSIPAEWFGWNGGEPGAVLNAAQAAAVFHKCVEVTYSSPNYLQTTPINAFNGIVIRGPGMGPEGVIRVVAGTTIDAQYQTPAFETQYASKPTTTASGVIRDFGLVNVCLDGNCGSNKSTPVTTNALKGIGFRVYGKRPKFRNVWVMRQPGIGFYSFFTSTPTEVDFGNTLGSESRDGSYFSNICVEDSQFEAFVFQGPSDITVPEIRAGWPSNSLWSTAYSAKKSLMFPKGRLRRVLVTATGSGYSQAGVTCTLTTDATTPATVQPVIVNGVVDHISVLTPGSNDATYYNIAFGGDGTGAAATGYVNNWIAGGVIINKGAEFGFIHSYGNVQGPALEVRNDDTGTSARFNAEYIMGESSWGGVIIADSTEYQIGRCDTHGNGLAGSPPAIPSLMLTSDRGGFIGNWKERREVTGGNGALAALVRGRGNRIHGRVQSNSGYAGDAVLVGGTGNAVDLTVQDINGFALLTDYDIQCANIRVVSNSNQGNWNNYANAASISNINSNIDISSYGAVAVASSYLGLNNFSTGQWKSIRAIDKRYDTGGVAYSSATVSATVDLTITTEQTFILTNPIIRTPAFSDMRVQVNPNSGGTIAGIQYAYVSSINSTQITVKCKLSVAGTGTGTVLVTIG
ncbi:hypothetical protein PQR64_30825 [Paraburkholderia phytofirmans]|uniref:hypothetical protein n=1 Tax=Paraburkholderia phytofirmans TaxID=261302 RepID=UPI0038BBB10B